MNRLPLHARLTLSLGIVLIVLAIAIAASITQIAERYRAETTQRLNEGIAMYVTNELALFDASGVNDKALKELAHRAMTVNPSAEVYLLSPDGHVTATLVPADRIVRDRVNLDPVGEFLSGSKRRPLYGDDPTSASRLGVFSVAPVQIEGKLSGYLYVVLASNKFESVSAAIRGNYSLKIALVAVASILLVTAMVGAVLFRQLTLPLRKLNEDMNRWSTSMGIGAPDRSVRDEMAALSGQFASMADRIKTQVDALAERDTQRRELIANVSHDLRTPLASLNGYLETILMKADSLSDDERREYLLIAYRHSQQLGRLVAALFELSKLETGATRPQLEVFSVAELLNDVALRFRLRAAQKKIELFVDVANADVAVRADASLIERVLENLIDNALKHTPPFGEIRMSARRLDESVRLNVADTGVGISADDLPNVFDRLYCGRSGSNFSTGLGLAIVKRIVELHGQRVSITSQLGMGANVEFGLPLPA